MRRLIAAGCVAVALMGGLASAVYADEVAELRAQMQAMEQRHQAEMAAFQARLAAVEHGERIVPATAGATTTQRAVPDWVYRTTWSGDVRLRNEYRALSGESRENTNRQRLRFRWGFMTQVSEVLRVAARLATGSLTDPRSTNQTFDDTFEKKNFNLDQAYVEYTPDVRGLDTAALIAGMMPNPFWKVGLLIWDGDLSFAGLAVQLARKTAPATLFLNAGVFPIDSDGFGGQTPTLWSTQVGASFTPFTDADSEILSNLKVTGALAYHDYLNTAKQALVSTQSGNTAAADDFNELNSSIELASQIGGMPVSLFGDWVRNVAIASNNDGYQIGFKVGKAREPWSLKHGWEAGYFYERLEADAAFDGFVDSDFGGGGTNHFGNVYWIKFAVLKNSTLGFKFYDTEQLTGAKDRNDTLQADWVTKF